MITAVKSGMADGSRLIGRSPCRWTDDIKNSNGCRFFVVENTTLNKTVQKETFNKITAVFVVLNLVCSHQLWFGLTECKDVNNWIKCRTTMEVGVTHRDAQ